MAREGLKSPSKSGQAIDVSKTDREGRGLRKVRYNPATARSLVRVPGFSGYVVSKRSDLEGLKNFLRYEGLKEREVKKIVREVELDPPGECPSGPLYDGINTLVPVGKSCPLYSMTLGQCTITKSPPPSLSSSSLVRKLVQPSWGPTRPPGTYTICESLG